MLSDLHLIDGFEGLRARFLTLNPTMDLDNGASGSTTISRRHTEDEILEAWLRTVLKLNEGTAQELRWLRDIVKALEEDAESRIIEDPDLSRLTRNRPKLFAEVTKLKEAITAHKKKDLVVFPTESTPTLASEIEQWKSLLPALTELRAWTFLRHLGRPIIRPDLSIRRFLWRLGLLDSEAVPPISTASICASELERIEQVTGLSTSALGRLIDWHTQSVSGLDGGNRCAAQPECDGCPFAAGCLFVRYRTGPSNVQSTRDDVGPQLQALARIIEREDFEVLDDSELVALFLFGGKLTADGLEISERLLRRFGGLQGLESTSLQELRQAPGMTEIRAEALKFGLELGRRVMTQPLRRGAEISDSMAVWEAFRRRYRHIPQEHFITLLLDSKNRVMESCVVSKGTLNGSLTHPREVFKQAVRHSASGIILMHNHPSGDPTPSPQDRAVTRRLSEAGEVLGIRVLDHIILGNETYYSFKDEGRMD